MDQKILFMIINEIFGLKYAFIFILFLRSVISKLILTYLTVIISSIASVYSCLLTPVLAIFKIIVIYLKINFMLFSSLFGLQMYCPCGILILAIFLINLILFFLGFIPIFMIIYLLFSFCSLCIFCFWHLSHLLLWFIRYILSLKCLPFLI